MTLQFLLQPTILLTLLVVSLVVDNRVDRDTRTRFRDDLVGIVGVEVRKIRAVDDVDSPWSGCGGGGFVVAGGVGGDVVGGEGFVWDDGLGCGGRGFCGGLFRVTGCDCGVSRRRVRWRKRGGEEYDAMDDGGTRGRCVCVKLDNVSVVCVD